MNSQEINLEKIKSLTGNDYYPAKEQVLKDIVEANHQKMVNISSEEIVEMVDNIAKVRVDTFFEQRLKEMEKKGVRMKKAREKGNFIVVDRCQRCGTSCDQKANSPHLIDHLCDDCKPFQRQGPPKKLKGGYMECRGCEKRRIWNSTGLCPPCFAEKV